jgi:hypothetical protein
MFRRFVGLSGLAGLVFIFLDVCRSNDEESHSSMSNESESNSDVQSRFSVSRYDLGWLRSWRRGSEVGGVG